MAHLYDRARVLDFKITSWPPEKRPRGQHSEVIEIGICKLDLNALERTTRHRMIVRPTKSQISAYCEEQTGLSKGEIKGGAPFAEACEYLKRDFQGRERIWATWGSRERVRLRRQLADERIRMPLGNTHLAIKSLATLLLGLPYEPELEETMSTLEIQPDRTPYLAETNAWNGAGVLAELLKRSRTGLKTFADSPQVRQETTGFDIT